MQPPKREPRPVRTAFRFKEAPEGLGETLRQRADREMRETNQILGTPLSERPPEKAPTPQNPPARSSAAKEEGEGAAKVSAAPTPEKDTHTVAAHLARNAGVRNTMTEEEAAAWDARMRKMFPAYHEDIEREAKKATRTNPILRHFFDE
jgi:hypothetical protein